MMAAQHRAARALFEKAWRTKQASHGLPEPTGPMLQLVAAVSALETSYASPAAWAKNSPSMASSHNYGAIQCKTASGPECVTATDHRQDGTPYQWGYKTYPSADAGAEDLIVHLAGAKRHSRPPLLEPLSVSGFAAGMYQDSYFGGTCPDALATYGKAAGRQTSQATHAPATTPGGIACDAEAQKRYAARLKLFADEIAAAMGEPTIPLENDLNLWPVLALLGVLAVGGAAYWIWSEYQDAPPPRTPIRRNAGRAEWRALYKTTCGPERDARRRTARAQVDEHRAKVAELVKGDRGEANKARRIETREGRRKEAARARADARELALRAELLELEARAEEPCESAKAELVTRTEREARAASERRTPAQRQASARTLERLAEEIEQEANSVEATIARDYRDPALGRHARSSFLKVGRKMVAAARKSREKGRSTTAAELFLHGFEENLDNERAELAEHAEKSDEDYSADEAAYYRELEAG